MGTDIHAFIESKDSQGYSMREQLDLDRDYQMFALLAGVRSGYKPVYPPRGLPEDASDAVVKEYQGWGEDVHTPSWLTADELEQYFTHIMTLHWRQAYQPLIVLHSP